MLPGDSLWLKYAIYLKLSDTSIDPIICAYG